MDRLPLIHILTRHWTHNSGICPEQETNQWPFILQDDSQPTEPCRSGINFNFKLLIMYYPDSYFWALIFFYNLQFERELVDFPEETKDVGISLYLTPTSSCLCYCKRFLTVICLNNSLESFSYTKSFTNFMRLKSLNQS